MLTDRTPNAHHVAAPRRHVVATCILAMSGIAAVAVAQSTPPAFPATLAGHAVLPAQTVLPAPDDAPVSLKTSGKYAGPNGRRETRPGMVQGTSFLSAKDAPRTTGIGLPFDGQPVQGFSGIKTGKEGRFWTLSDNGYGSKANSPDAMLMFHEIRPDWTRGTIERLKTVFLRDPDHKVPFHIVNEATKERYLTGADLDIESIQIIGNDVWFGDELGPYLVKTDLAGKVLAFHETRLDGKVLQSPDHFAVTTPGVPGPFATSVRRSRGYEGMAASKDGRFLYPMLEGPLWNATANAWETKDGRESLRILEFDVQRGDWTGRSWTYVLEANGHNIGDFNMIDADTALVIERDNGEGLEADACPAGAPPRSDCHNAPARFKRVYKISLKDTEADGVVRKIGYIDLLAIDDPKSVAKTGHHGRRFSFPFVTIENVDVVDDAHIIVANDNNLPFSSGRRIGRNDDNEFVLLHVPAFLRAR